MANVETDRRRLLQVCRTLPPAETLILQLFAVIYAPIDKADLNRAALRYHSRLQHTGEIVDSLVRRGVVEIIAPPESTGAPATYRAHQLLREPLAQAAVRSGIFHSLVGVARAELWHEHDAPASYEHAVARARAALYQGNEKLYLHTAEIAQRRFPQELLSPVASVWENGTTDAWLKNLPKSFQLRVLADLLNHALFFLRPADELLRMLEELTAPAPPTNVAALLAAQYLYRGKFSKALKVAKTLPADYRGFFQAWIVALAGRLDEARAWLNQNPTPVLPVRLALEMLVNFHAGIFSAEIAPKNSVSDPLLTPLWWLRDQRLARRADELTLAENASPLARLFTYLAWHWESDAALTEHQASLSEFFEQARANGYWWLAAETAAILAAREANGEIAWAAKLANAIKNCKCEPQVTWLAPRAGWERPLNALAAALAETAPVGDSAMRVFWQLIYHEPTQICEISAYQQTLTAAGQWGRGKRLSWAMLAQGAADDFLTDGDRQICAAIVKETRDRTVAYELDYALALPALIGHPRVFLENGARVEISGGEPEVLVTNCDGGAKVQLLPNFKETDAVALTRETPSRFRIVRIKPLHRELAKIIGAGLQFPPPAFSRLKKVIGDLSAHLAVQSEIGGIGESAETIAVDARLRAHLLPRGDSLQVEFFVRPFGDRGNYYRPGYGANLLISEFSGARLAVNRDLPAEISAFEQVIAACPALTNGEQHEQSWRLDDPLDCLEFLLQLQNLPDLVIPEWTQGGRRYVEIAPQFSRVNVQRNHEWFELTGEIKINETLTLDFQELLKRAAAATGRFVKINDDHYLALTETFKQQLLDLAAFGDIHSGNLRLPPLAAIALENLASEVNDFQSDLAWKQLIAKLKAPEKFHVPPTFRGELRDYQRQGFEWLANLAAWDFGACLADDMGLGKTVQTLALLAHRADRGAALIVAPTSVAFNWLTETARFAPSLNAVIFGDGDRETAIATAGKNSVVICSYTLLRQTEDLFTARDWATIVLDEAQAIKNAATKSSQTVMKLRAEFRMITTGTPIENHLGELWNLFHFLNRGLLGSRQRFHERFAAPIERDHDFAARERLQRLLRPFILRRLKTQVLVELPPRTEILKTLPPSEAELAFYEALRRSALEKLHAPSRGNRGERQLRILAEIMRLRRACCSPRLVDPASDVASSKLAEFGAIAANLRENQHRALVFSQFVDHLALIREYLNREKISYQYLDGSTPEKQRRRAVENFQSGDGDFFLISLKAGGQGLNLTAAEYVIHLDPWWNPAVEAQASDRAHRIGQTKPVTIYRLVLQHTIEEKIVAMHAHKRQLAESILNGDSSGKIDADELLALIRDPA